MRFGRIRDASLWLSSRNERMLATKGCCAAWNWLSSSAEALVALLLVCPIAVVAFV